MTRSNLTFRRATQADVHTMGGAALRGLRAWAAELDGRLMGVGGTFWGPAYLTGFMDLSPELLKRPRWVVQCVKHGMAEVRERGLPVVVIAQPGTPTAPTLLRHFGFKHAGHTTHGESYILLQS